MGFFGVVYRSLVKGVRDVGVIFAVGGLTAVLADPDGVITAFSGLGPYAPLIAMGVAILARAGLDALTHRDNM